MLNNVETQLRKTELYETDSIYIEGIPVKLGISQHFDRYEFMAFAKRKFQYNFFDKDLECYKDFSSLKKIERTYGITLAFFRRISLPLEIALSSPASYNNYPIEELKNFIHFNELFDKYYAQFEKVDSENINKKIGFRNFVTQLIFKLWLSGYGIAPDYTENVIDNELLTFLLNWKRESNSHGTRRYAKAVRFLGFILIDEKFSPVDVIPKMKEGTSLEERELGKWNQLLSTTNAEVVLELYSFTFGHLRQRIDKQAIIEYTDVNQKVHRETFDSISDGTWINYSIGLLTTAELLIKNGYFTIDDSLKRGIVDIMTHEVAQLEYASKSSVRISCKYWLQYYIKANNLSLNINKIIPLSLRNKEKVFGKMLNYGAAQILIQTLLDDNCTYFNDNVLSDYRVRRAALLQVASGQRGSEICYLLYDCIKTDNMGIPWLIFHKTKGNKENKVLATPEIQKWVSELQSVAPKKKILISSSQYPSGDNLCEYRLLANQFDEGPLIYEAINKFLVRIQDKLWNGNSPNKYYFKSHDLRRIHALYMRLTGKTISDIQDQLGHSNVYSQLPYLSTKPLKHQKWFKEIQLTGVYKNISTDSDNESIEIEPIISKSIEISSEKYNSDKLIQSLLQISNDVAKFEIPKQVQTIQPTGFPMRIHSCTASTMVNCGHTELHCFSCDYYKPDSDTLIDHKVEIFRYMVLVLYQNNLAKKIKDILENELIQIRSSDIIKQINDSFEKLFIKFDLCDFELVQIKQELECKSSAYIKKYIKTNPNPTFLEAKSFIEGGDIIGK